MKDLYSENTVWERFVEEAAHEQPFEEVDGIGRGREADLRGEGMELTMCT